jgi:hypothetical protein
MDNDPPYINTLSAISNLDFEVYENQGALNPEQTRLKPKPMGRKIANAAYEA